MTLDKLEDHRIGCLSLMTSLDVTDFLKIVEPAYADQGGLQGQRPALKTKTGLSIRSRLVSDLRRGAVVPPVVVGIQCLDSSKLSEFRDVDSADGLLKIVESLPSNSISIIDGMQRTTAFLEAMSLGSGVNLSKQRIEFWISDNIGSLVYRMLVLNTGQVPWEIARQLEAVYSQFLQKLTQRLGDAVEIFKRDDDRRRRDAAQYQASSIIRLFLSFSSRRMEFDLKDKIAEDFARLDAVEASAHEQFFEMFVEALRLLISVDQAFSNASPAANKEAVRIPDGRSIFLSFPAQVGFVTAVAIKIMDEPGFDVDWGDAPAKMTQVSSAVDALTSRIGALSPDEIRDFLALDTLNQRLSVRTGQVGRWEREVFYRAFESMIRNAERLQNMEPCWRA